jgi:hypothetical protein
MKTGPDAAPPTAASKQGETSKLGPAGGHSGASGTCQPSNEPNQTVAPPPPVRVPYVIQG